MQSPPFYENSIAVLKSFTKQKIAIKQKIEYRQKLLFKNIDKATEKAYTKMAFSKMQP